MSYAALEQPIVQPTVRIIKNITQAFPAEVTTELDHSYGTGMIVRIRVPDTFGMTQINLQQGTITVTSSVTFTIDIDSTSYDAFVTPPNQVPPDAQTQFAQVVPIGEVNETLAFAFRNVLPY